MPRILLLMLLLVASLPSQLLHVGNYSGLHNFEGWIETTIDWAPPHSVGKAQGNTYVLGDELVPGLWEIDIYVKVPRGTVQSIDFSEAEAGTGVDGPPPETPAVYPRIGGVPFPLPVSSVVKGAGIDVHWRTRVGPNLTVVVDIWFKFYPGQHFAYGEMQVHACNIDRPDKFGTIPHDFALTFGEGTITKGPHSAANGVLIPAGTTIAVGQGYPAIPLTATLLTTQIESASALAELSISKIGVQSVWPKIGNPLWHAQRPDPRDLADADWDAIMGSLDGWDLTPKTFQQKQAQTSGGEFDQWAVGGELWHGTKSLGSEWLMWGRGASMARRPGLWSRSDGGRLALDRPGLALFEGYPFVRGGTTDLLGLTNGVPSRNTTKGYWNWAEHKFHNALGVGYWITGSRALQWQLQRRGVTWLYEHTDDSNLTTTTYTGADRGYLWSCLQAWWYHQTIEDVELRNAIADRWRWRWEHIGKPRMTRPEPWPVFYSGSTWFAWQKGMVYFLDLAGETFEVPEAREAALTAAIYTIENAYEDDGTTLIPYPYVRLEDGKIRTPLSEHSNPWGGTSGWMTSAAGTRLRHDPRNEKARRIIDRDVAVNRLGGHWIPPDAIIR